MHASDLVDRLPEPDPALVRPSPRDRRGARRQARRRRSWRQRALLGALVVAAMVSGTAAALAGYLSHKLDQLDYIEVALSAAPPPGEPRNLLIVGSDSRDNLVASPDEVELDSGLFLGDGAAGSGQRSDTIIVVRIDPAAASVDVLSIPRDLWVPIPGTGGSQRINTAYAGGPQRLIDTIEENFDVPIHHYVEVDFVGFSDLVSAVGGVSMWFDTPVRDANSGLDIATSGCHVLDGPTALAFTRARHLQYQLDSGRWSTDGTGDLGRITRQQVFLRRAVDQVSQLGLTDALTLNRLLDVGITSVTLDSGLGLGRLRDLAQRFAEIDGNDLRTHALPTYSFRTSGGAAVEGLVEAEAQPALNIFRGLPPDTLTPVQIADLTVLNGTGEAGRAALVADALGQVGFGVEATGNVDGDALLARTTIRHAPGSERAADLLERHLTDGAVVVLDRTLDDGEVVLEVGSDFTTIGRNARPSVDESSGGSHPIDSTDVRSRPDAVPEVEAIGVAPDPSVSCT